MYPSNDTLPLIEDDRIVTDGAMFLTGPIRFRQLRLDKDGRVVHSVERFNVIQNGII